MELKDGKKHTCGLRRPFGVAGMANSDTGEKSVVQWLGGELGNIGCMPANLLTLSCQHLLRTENMMLSCLILL